MPATAAEPREVAEFIASTEPQCAAHTAYAAEDAQDLAHVARQLQTFMTLASARLGSMSYATKGFDEDDLRERLADQIEECLTPEAARLFRRELRDLTSLLKAA